MYGAVLATYIYVKRNTPLRWIYQPQIISIESSGARHSERSRPRRHRHGRQEGDPCALHLGRGPAAYFHASRYVNPLCARICICYGCVHHIWSYPIPSVFVDVRWELVYILNSAMNSNSNFKSYLNETSFGPRVSLACYSCTKLNLTWVSKKLHNTNYNIAEHSNKDIGLASSGIVEYILDH
jgi:hypothetical protein